MAEQEQVTKPVREQVYRTFVEAGFEKEARQLSRIVNGQKVIFLGHYIAAVDNILDLERQFPDRAPNEDRTKFYDKCVKHIGDCVSLISHSRDTSSLLDSLKKIFYEGRRN